MDKTSDAAPADESNHSPADASLEARMKAAAEALWMHKAPFSPESWAAVVRAVDASRPGLSEEEARAWCESAWPDGWQNLGTFIQHEIVKIVVRASRGEIPDEVRAATLPEIQSPITDAAIDEAVVEAKADPLAGLPEEERRRIESVGLAARFRTYRDSGETQHDLATKNERDAIAREVAAYHERQSVPETLTREEAEQRLRANGATATQANAMLNDVRRYLDGTHGAIVATTGDILRAYARWLDAKASEQREGLDRLTRALRGEAS